MAVTLGKTIRAVYNHSPLKALRRCAQPFINYLYYDKSGNTIILRDGNWEIVEVDGLHYYYDRYLTGELKRKNDPVFHGLRTGDIAVSIGASVGDWAIPMSFRASHVYAVEPLFTDKLLSNIALNWITNITVLPFALSGKATDRLNVSYLGEIKTVQAKTFQELKQICGGRIDYLRCDCEGAEWYISPVECYGIRELRFEFHIRRSNKNYDNKKFIEWLDWFLDNRYAIVMDKISELSDIYKEQWEVAASKRE